MKENVLDVLTYLFDNYWDEEAAVETDEATLTCELEQAGFHSSEIDKAFTWLEELALLNPAHYAALAKLSPETRCFAPEELQKLDLESRRLLIQLASQGHLDFPKLEIIIDRAMALDCHSINLEDMKQVVALVVFNLPEEALQEQDNAWLEELFFEMTGEQKERVPELLH